MPPSPRKLVILSNDLILATVCWLSNGVAVCASALQRRSAPSGEWKLQLTLQLSAPHNCNKTKIKELYKSYRTHVADQALLDIMQIVFPCSQWKRRVAVRARTLWRHYLLRRKRYKIGQLYAPTAIAPEAVGVLWCIWLTGVIDSQWNTARKL